MDSVTPLDACFFFTLQYFIFLIMYHIQNNFTWPKNCYFKFQDDDDDISKRQRKGSISASANTSNIDNTNKDGKRLREDTPPKSTGASTSPLQNIPKKICVTDEIECSMSSSVYLRMQGQKRKATGK